MSAPSLSWWRAVAEDFRFCRELCDGRTSQALGSYGFYAVAVYRFGHAVNRRPACLLRWFLLVPYHVLRILTELSVGVSIARSAEIGVPVMVHHHGGVFVAAGSTIGTRCQIYHQVTIGESGGQRMGRPAIGDEVVIGAGAKVLGPICVGNGARVGANAVVLSDVPPGALAVGVPAVLHHAQSWRRSASL